MKNIIKIATFLLAGTFVVTSCDLNREPVNQIPLKNSLQTMQDATSWDTRMYTVMRGLSYGVFSMIQDIQSDELDAGANYGNNYGPVYKWDQFTSSSDDVSPVFLAYYVRLYDVNFLINHGANVPTDSTTKPILDSYMGDAHFVRAYIYSQLAIRWGKSYDPATADRDLSVPMVLEANTKLLPKRSTNKEVYAQVLKDVNTALSLYDKAKMTGKVKPYRFSSYAFLALRARTELYMQDWKDAYDDATAVISSGKFPLVAPDEANFKKMWVNDQSTEDILTLFAQRPDEIPNRITFYSSNTLNNGNLAVCQPNFLPTQGIIDLFSDKDLRKGVYFEKCDGNPQYMQQSNFYSGAYVISKFKGNPALASSTDVPAWGGYQPDGTQMPKVLRVAEMYLVAAEAAFNLKDEANAKKYLNELRASRGLGAVTTTGDALRDDIRAERTRELAFEGFRLWDLRRWGLPMNRMPQQTNYMYYSNDANDGKGGFVQFDPSQPTVGNLLDVFALDLQKPNDDHNFVWPIPHNDMLANPNLKGQQNPGYGE